MNFLNKRVVLNKHTTRRILVFVTLPLMVACTTDSHKKTTSTPTLQQLSNFEHKQIIQTAFDSGNYKNAADQLNHQIEEGVGELHKAWFNLGACYWNQKKKKESIKAYEKSVVIFPPYVKGHTRLAKHYFEMGDKPKAVRHAKTVKAIRKVERAAEPLWLKAYGIRGRGADWYKAEALIYSRMAETYTKNHYPELAAFKQKEAETSLAKEEEERERPIQVERAAKQEADDRAFNAELLATIGDATALVLNVDAPEIGSESLSSSPGVKGEEVFSAISPGGGRSASLAVQSIGSVQQSYQAYTDILQMYDGALREHRQAAYQKGQTAKAALADPGQVQRQHEAEGRTDDLRRKLKEAEKRAKQFLEMEAEKKSKGKDTLDL